MARLRWLRCRFAGLLIMALGSLEAPNAENIIGTPTHWGGGRIRALALALLFMILLKGSKGSTGFNAFRVFLMTFSISLHCFQGSYAGYTPKTHTVDTVLHCSDSLFYLRIAVINQLRQQLAVDQGWAGCRGVLTNKYEQYEERSVSGHVRPSRTCRCRRPWWIDPGPAAQNTQNQRQIATMLSGSLSVALRLKSQVEEVHDRNAELTWADKVLVLTFQLCKCSMLTYSEYSHST